MHHYGETSKVRHSTMSVPETLRLYSTGTSIRIEPVYNDNRKVAKMMEIDRREYGIRAVEAAVVGDSVVSIVYGILGIINLLAGPYLVVVTQKKRVGAVLGHDVWRVCAADLLCLAPFPLLTEKQREDEMRYTQLMMAQLTSGTLYYSYSFDLTRTVQWTMSLPREASERPLWMKANKDFMWNFPLSHSMQEAGNLDEFILPVIQGYVGTALCPVDFHQLELCLISRRARGRPGKRYTMRGVDREGHTANFCETELVVQWRDVVTSHVQTRGSIPVFWTQNVNLWYHPPICIQNEDHFYGFARHCQAMLQTYGSTLFLNLIGSGGTDAMLNKAFVQQLDHFASSDARYIHFDFNRECRNLKWDRLSLLMDVLSPVLSSQGFFVSTPHGITATQSGVVRSNCIDCLDRTNVVQSVVANHVLALQLSSLGIISHPEGIDKESALASEMRRMWADNGDALSTIYAGTGALKTDFTRTGHRTVWGMMRDGANSVMRYYLNNFADGWNEDAIDLFLCNYHVTLDAPSPFVIDMTQQRLRLLPLAFLGSCILLPLGALLPLQGSHARVYYSLAVTVMASIFLRASLRNGTKIVDSPSLVRLDTPVYMKKNY